MIHDFELEELDVQWVIERGDCVLLCMTWMYYLKQNHGKKDATDLKPMKVEAVRLKETDMDRYWLFCYEALSVSQLSGEWKSIKKAGISFIKPEIV